ncbi:MAG TPA: hypothetical protein VMT05_04850 [Terriglobales bacterium]|nr:hypothetical protein [Terriglobales bacterium]
MAEVDPIFRSLNKIPHLSQLVKEGLLKEHTLVAAHKNKDLQKLNCKYLSDPKYAADTLTESTVLYYPNGDVMALFLKGDIFKSSRKALTPLIPETIRDRAFEGLSQIELSDVGFHEPKRRETKGAIQWNPDAKELVLGYTDRGSIELTNATKAQVEHYEKILPLIRLMNGIYARVLPKEYAEEGRHKLSRAQFRQAGTPFTTVTVNRNCPTALHKDIQNHPGLIAMTTAAASGTTGGEFCFPQYALKVPVKPGDLLIAATSREWHCNLSPVAGLKFSVVCYRRRLSNLAMLRTYGIKLRKARIRELQTKRPRLP